MKSCLFDEELDHSLGRTLQYWNCSGKIGRESRERAFEKYATVHGKSEFETCRSYSMLCQFSYTNKGFHGRKACGSWKI